MLVLFETPAGYAIFKLLNEKILNATDTIYESFESPEKASKVLKLKAFKKFKDTTEALAATTAAVEGKMGKTLKKVLKKLVCEETQEKLLVADAKLGSCIKEKLEIPCESNSAVQELMRCIRGQTDALITGLPQKDMSAMALGLAHSLSRYKLKFSPDKVDTMIVQAISLLDDLDKELNNYIMRCREWYGWHFPEMGKVVQDNLAYAKVVRAIGDRTNAAKVDLSAILPEELEQEVKEVAEISMGTEVSESDILNISYLCDQVIEITEYRAQLYDYLKNRMMAVAPNLTILVGELVGARLIAHAGSLMNLAKQPASTVQILGAEKALFRALKTKHDTPKYGLIYHASLVGQSNPKHKGKISRMLAAKAALAIRVDALADESSTELGIEHKAKLEIKLREMESGFSRRLSGTGKAKAKFDRYENTSEVKTYNEANDSTLPAVPKKRSLDEDEEEQPPSKKSKKDKKRKSEGGDAETPKKVKSEPEEVATPSSEKKKKKKKKDADQSQDAEEMEEAPTSEKKKKKKKKVKEEPDSD